MQWPLFIALLVTLLAIGMEDFKHRAVRVLWFPVLLLLSACYAFSFVDYVSLATNVTIILVFLVIQATLLLMYFMLKFRKWINLTKQYIGWGDILFLLAVVPLFSPLAYIFFYTISLLFAILVVLAYHVVRKPLKHVPLAGIQACCLVSVLAWHHLVHNILFMQDLLLMDL